MRTKVLIDSGFLYALFMKDDPDYHLTRRAFRTPGLAFLIPQVVLTETAFLFNRSGGMRSVATFLQLLDETHFPLEPVTYDDLKRAMQLLRTFPGTKLDFVDCCILAMAERLNVSHVATLDRRDFSIPRLQTGESLTILP